jgi:hypothetical protein
MDKNELERYDGYIAVLPLVPNTADKTQLLLIEDQTKHLEDAKRIADQIEERGEISVGYSNTFEHTMDILKHLLVECIVSDVFFPSVAEGEPIENGTFVCDYALKHKIPIVLCTNTYHHGKKTQPVFDYCLKEHVPLFDCNSYALGDGEAETKDWKSSIISAMGLARVKDDRENGRVEDFVGKSLFDTDGPNKYIWNLTQEIGQKYGVADDKLDEICSALNQGSIHYLKFTE